MLTFLIWASGWIVSYALTIRTTTLSICKIDNEDRLMCSLVSCGSWITVVMVSIIESSIFIIKILMNIEDKDCNLINKYVIRYLKKLEPKRSEEENAQR